MKWSYIGFSSALIGPAIALLFGNPIRYVGGALLILGLAAVLVGELGEDGQTSRPTGSTVTKHGQAETLLGNVLVASQRLLAAVARYPIQWWAPGGWVLVRISTEQLHVLETVVRSESFPTAKQVLLQALSMSPTSRHAMRVSTKALGDVDYPSFTWLEWGQVRRASRDQERVRALVERMTEAAPAADE